jgi:hypothetical protein
MTSLPSTAPPPATLGGSTLPPTTQPWSPSSTSARWTGTFAPGWTGTAAPGWTGTSAAPVSCSSYRSQLSCPSASCVWSCSTSTRRSSSSSSTTTCSCISLDAANAKTKDAIIAGSIAGGVMLCFIVLFIVAFLQRRKRLSDSLAMDAQTNGTSPGIYDGSVNPNATPYTAMAITPGSVDPNTGLPIAYGGGAPAPLPAYPQPGGLASPYGQMPGGPAPSYPPAPAYPAAPAFPYPAGGGAAPVYPFPAPTGGTPAYPTGAAAYPGATFGAL